MIQNPVLAAFWSKSDNSSLGNEIIKEEYPESKDVEPRLESDSPILPWLEEQFGENKGIVEKNYLAVWSELNASEANVAAYIDELFCDKNLQFIVRENKEDFDSVQQRRMLDEAAETNGINTGEGESDVDSDVDGDTSIIVANSHLGTYSDYMMHLGERLRLFFNSLPKLDRYSYLI